MINNLDELAIRNFATVISDLLTHREFTNHLSICRIEDVATPGNKIERVENLLSELNNPRFVDILGDALTKDKSRFGEKAIPMVTY